MRKEKPVRTERREHKLIKEICEFHSNLWEKKQVCFQNDVSSILHKPERKKKQKFPIINCKILA